MKAARFLILTFCVFLPLFVSAAERVSSVRESGSRVTTYRSNPYVSIGPLQLDTRVKAEAQIPAEWTHAGVLARLLYASANSGSISIAS